MPIIPAQYLQIALDLAKRIASGDLPEGKRIYGRSVMASEYGVSPETIRRALRLLADMKVVDIKPQSGAVVLSADNARRYIESFTEDTSMQALRSQLKDIILEAETLHRRMADTLAAFIQSRETFSAANEPFPNYEIPIPFDSALIGKSIGALNFWQSTGATIVAIRRGQTVILSPGPYAELYAGDVIILVGIPSAIDAAQHFISAKERYDDSI